MVYSDWTPAGANITHGLDGAEKYAGVSAYRANTNVMGTYTGTLTRDDFSVNQVRVVLWTKARVSGAGSRVATCGVQHPSYGIEACSSASFTTIDETPWEKWRVTFWYDASANTKWSRLEKWVDSAWEQQGTDTNRGAGAPAADSIVLNSHLQDNTLTQRYCWYDELEVYAVSA